MRAVYCKCKNTYSISCKTNSIKGCKTPDYWKQGIGRINALPIKTDIFDITFDETFK